MKKYFFFQLSKLFKNHKRILGGIAIYWLFTFYLLISLFTPTTKLNVQDISLNDVFIVDTYDTRGDRMKLKLVSGNYTYYVWYPRGTYGYYKESIQNDLLSGIVNQVTVKFDSRQSVRDKLTNQIRIVDIRAGETCYYSLEDEEISLQNNKIGTAVVFAMFLFLGIILQFIFLVIA